MTLTNRDMADLFKTVADMLQIRGDNIHRVLSYRRASETIYELPRDIRAIAAEGGLTDLPNIGKTLADKINEMLETGKLEFYERLASEIPPGLVDIMNINGVGPKKAKLFWDELNITDIHTLENAAKAGKLANLSGMGAKSEQKILEGIASLARRSDDRVSIGTALPSARAILNLLLSLDGVLKGEIAGSIRRGRPTIGDVDILIAVADLDADGPLIMNTFVAMESVARILGHGPTKSSIELLNGLQVDLRVIAQEKWGTALNYFTGSKNHNVRMRQLALAKRLSLNEHAYSPVDDNNDIIEDAEKIYCSTEEEVYAVVDLPYIHPELREDSGEIEAAQNHALPKLITLDDIRSDLHMHTTWSDGRNSVKEMAEAARRRGYSHIVITDHSQYSTIANGLTIERFMEQRKEVLRVNEEMGDDFQVLHGIEMDIHADATLDYPDEILEQLDFVIASIHLSLKQPREQITKRYLAAITNPHVDMIAHPQTQLIGQREPLDADWDTIFAAAKKHQTALEVNAAPKRLDLPAPFARRAAEMGIPLAINTDAHAVDSLDYIQYGIHTARRGWVEAESVLNTWSLDKFLAWLRR